MPVTDLPFLPRSKRDALPDLAPALADDRGVWITHGELRDRVETLAACFKSDKRGLILSCLPSTIDGAVAYLGAVASGHTVSLANAAMPSLPIIIRDYQPDWIVVPQDAKAVSGYQTVAWPVASLRLLRRETVSGFAPHDDLFLLLLTSGSTGSSKGVRLSYANLAANTRSIIASLGLTADRRAVGHLPLYYSFGLSVLHAQLAVGGSCLLTEHSLMSKEFWQQIRDHHATLFPGVPYHYKMLARLGLARLDAPRLNMFLQAGGPMDETLTRALWQQLEPRKGQMFVMYGQTEASPRISCLAVHNRPDKIGSCGVALPDGALSIEDGEVIYRGPNVMMGYALTREDLTKDDETHGRLATGDIGTLDEEGFLFLQGRRQRFAKMLGQRVSLDDLEKLAGTVAPTVAMEDADIIKLFVAGTETAIGARVVAKLAEETGMPPSWFAPRMIASIPHTDSGKIDYAALRDAP